MTTVITWETPREEIEGASSIIANELKDKFKNGDYPHACSDLIHLEVISTLSEIANHFEVDEHDVVMAMDSAKMPISLYTPFDDEEDAGLTLLDRVEGQDDGEFVDKFAVKDMIEKLNERDKKIILMRYFDDKTQSEIAKRLGVSQVQVSRLENKILENLRKRLLE